LYLLIIGIFLIISNSVKNGEKGAVLHECGLVEPGDKNMGMAKSGGKLPAK
jgi:hypothetical protein